MTRYPIGTWNISMLKVGDVLEFFADGNEYYDLEIIGLDEVWWGQKIHRSNESKFGQDFLELIDSFHPDNYHLLSNNIKDVPVQAIEWL